MRFNSEELRPNKPQPLKQVKRALSANHDARWRGVPYRTADAAAGYMRLGHKGIG